MPELALGWEFGIVPLVEYRLARVVGCTHIRYVCMHDAFLNAPTYDSSYLSRSFERTRTHET